MPYGYWMSVGAWILVCFILLLILYLVIGATCVNPLDSEPRHVTKAETLRRWPGSNVYIIYLPASTPVLQRQLHAATRYLSPSSNNTIDLVVKPGKWTSTEQGVFRVQSQKELSRLSHIWNRVITSSLPSIKAETFPMILQTYHPGPWELRITLKRTQCVYPRHRYSDKCIPLQVQHCIAWKLQHNPNTGTHDIIRPAHCRYPANTSQQQQQKSSKNKNHVSSVFLHNICIQVWHLFPHMRTGTVDVRTHHPDIAEKDYQILEVNGGFGQSLLKNTNPSNPWTSLVDVGQWSSRTIFPTLSQYHINIYQWIQRFRTELTWAYNANRFNHVSFRIHHEMEKENGIPYGRTAGQL